MFDDFVFLLSKSIGLPKPHIHGLFVLQATTLGLVDVLVLQDSGHFSPFWFQSYFLPPSDDPLFSKSTSSDSKTIDPPKTECEDSFHRIQSCNVSIVRRYVER